AGAPEGQGRVNLVLDLDQRVQDHRAALVEVELVGVGARVGAVVRAPAVYLEGAHVLRAGRRGEVLALGDAGILGECELCHFVFLSPWLSTRVAWAAPHPHPCSGCTCAPDGSRSWSCRFPRR